MGNQKRKTDATKTEEIRPNWQCQCQKSHQDDLLLHCNSTTRFRCWSWSWCGCSCCCVAVSNLQSWQSWVELVGVVISYECKLFGIMSLLAGWTAANCSSFCRLNCSKLQHVWSIEIAIFYFFNLPRSISFSIYNIISWWGQWTMRG